MNAPINAMLRNTQSAIIIHGMQREEVYYSSKSESPSNSHWIPWLQHELNVAGILTQTPEMPEPYNPDYNKWKDIFEQFKVDEHTVLVGHSCGGGFILRYLSENNIKVGRVVLVAPWINSKREKDTTMFDGLQLHKDLVSKTNGVTIFSSTDDYLIVTDSIKVITDTIANLNIVEFKNYGHFCFDDMKTREFPELLSEITK